MKPLEANLDRIAALAKQRQNTFEVLRYTLELLEDELPDEALDALVDRIAVPIVAAIDCKQCANCCRSLDVYLTPGDAARLAEGLHVSVYALMEKQIEQEEAAEVDEWGKFRAKPCVFLKGKLCSVYQCRPDSCRDYPAFTPDFRWLMPEIIEGAPYCPIIYHVLDALNRVIQARAFES